MTLLSHSIAFIYGFLAFPIVLYIAADIKKYLDFKHK